MSESAQRRDNTVINNFPNAGFTAQPNLAAFNQSPPIAGHTYLLGLVNALLLTSLIADEDMTWNVIRFVIICGIMNSAMQPVRQMTRGRNLSFFSNDLHLGPRMGQVAANLEAIASTPLRVLARAGMFLHPLPEEDRTALKDAVVETLTCSTGRS